MNRLWIKSWCAGSAHCIIMVGTHNPQGNNNWIRVYSQTVNQIVARLRYINVMSDESVDRDINYYRSDYRDSAFIPTEYMSSLS